MSTASAGVLTGPMGRRLTDRLDAVRAILADRGVVAAHIFGSVARGEDTERSDYDFLVDMPAGRRHRP